MASITELLISKYLNEFGKNEFDKLYKSIDKRKHYFNNEFFHTGVNNAIKNKNIDALIQLSTMSCSLKRFIEAEYMLTKAYEIDDKNQDLIYALIDVYCLRHALFHAIHFIDLLEPNIDNRVLKSKIKVSLLTGLTNDTDSWISELNDNVFDNNELTFLMIQYAKKFNKNELIYRILSSKTGKNILNNFTANYKTTLKKMLNGVLLERLRKIHE